MPASFKFTGVRQFLTNMNKEIEGIHGRTLAGLINAVIIVQRDAEPGTPVDLGNLRSSWFSVSHKSSQNLSVVPATFRAGGHKGGRTLSAEELMALKEGHQTRIAGAAQEASKVGSTSRPVMIFGYTAHYAPFVHENADAKFKRPKAHAYWFSLTIERNYAEILEEIRKHARIT